MNLKLLTAGGLLASLLAAAPAQAESISFDDVLLHGGTMGFAGGAGDSLVGTDIILDSVSGYDTPSNVGAHGCFACELNFTTGSLISAVALGGGAYQYTFAAGGSITVTGGVPDASIPSATVLASGTFSAPVIATVQSGKLEVQFGIGSDEKDRALVKYFGYDPDETTWTFANTTIAAKDVSAITKAGQAFSGTVTNADFENTPTIGGSNVPVPAAIWLFGSAVAGMGTIGGWRRRASAA